MIYIDPDQAARIRRVPHFMDSDYGSYDVNATLGHYVRHYVEQLRRLKDIDERNTVADIGTGYGWLAIAFALETKANIIAVDNNAPRLAAARRLAEIIGVADRIDWRVGSLGSLPIADGEADSVYCIEVVEHVRDRTRVFPDLTRISTDVLVLSTPNGLLPIVAHDTGLPLCHWLPPRYRQVYANAMGRGHLQDNNRFWTPFTLRPFFEDFEIVSRFLHYGSFDHYQAAFPVYSGGRMRLHDSGMLHLYYRTASMLGKRAQFVLFNLACTLRRRASRGRLTQAAGKAVLAG